MSVWNRPRRSAVATCPGRRPRAESRAWPDSPSAHEVAKLPQLDLCHSGPGPTWSNVGSDRRATGARFDPVVFEGGGQQLAATLAGDVDVSLMEPSEFIDQAKAGTMRALVVLGDAPAKGSVLEQVPTAEQAGLHGAFAAQWRAFFAAPGITDEQRAWWEETRPGVGRVTVLRLLRRRQPDVPAVPRRRGAPAVPARLLGHGPGGAVMARTRTRGVGELVFACVLTAVSVGAAIVAATYGFTARGQLGPGAVPMVVGVLLAVVGAALVLTARRPIRAALPVDGTADTGEPDEHEPSGTRKAFLVLALLAVAVALGRLVGLIVAIAAFILVVGLVVERLGAARSLVLAAIGAGLFHVVFDLVLDIPLPGPW